MFGLWILWFVLTLFVIFLAVVRKLRTRKEDDIVHLTGAEAAIPRQLALADSIDKIDHWGKLLTVVDVAFGVILVAIMFYNTWQQSLALEK